MSEAGIVVAARMGSTRLPGKHLKRFGSGNVIGSCLARCKASGLKVVLTVPVLDMYSFSEAASGVLIYGGDERNVLRRMIGAAEINDIDPVIRVTGDCPFPEPSLINQMEIAYRQLHLDLLSNVWPIRRFAKGLDVEVVKLAALKKIASDACRSEQEHVTHGLYHRDGFVIQGFANTGEWPDENSEPLCIDTAEDLERLRKRIAA